MRFCKHCGIQIADDAKFCQGCGGNVEQKSSVTAPQPVQDTPESNAPRAASPKKILLFAGGAIALIILVIACIVGATRCEVEGCDNRAMSGSDYCGIHSCIYCDDLRISGSLYCYFHYTKYESDTSSSYTNKVYASDLRISGVKLSSNSSYTIVEGKITNNSDQTVSYVKIKGAFKNSSGTVIDTDWTYAVGTEGLAPGESCTWRMSVTKDYSIKDCTVTVIDFDY